jgi:hypothetical protein
MQYNDEPGEMPGFLVFAEDQRTMGATGFVAFANSPRPN